MTHILQMGWFKNQPEKVETIETRPAAFIKLQYSPRISMFMFTFHLCGWERCFFFLFDLLSFLAQQGMTRKRGKLQVISKENSRSCTVDSGICWRSWRPCLRPGPPANLHVSVGCLFFVGGKKRMENGSEFLVVGW